MQVTRPFGVVSAAAIALLSLGLASCATTTQPESTTEGDREPASGSPTALALAENQPIDDAAVERQPAREPEEGHDLGYLARWEEWYDARSYPNRYPNWQVYREAREARNAVPWIETPGGGGGGGLPPGFGDDFDITGPGINNWRYLGPRNMDVYTRNGQGLPPVNGRINALAFDPTDPDDVYYAASACGGVWKTVDGGEHWFPLSDRWDELYTSSIAVAPDGTVYVGTGDFPGRLGSGIGLMVSHDGGVTWIKRGTIGDIDGDRISDIVIDPDDPERIVVCSGDGESTVAKVYLSTNGGDHFDDVIDVDAEWSDLSVGVSFFDLRYYYAVGTSRFGDEWIYHIYRSANRGETWTELSSPVNPPPGDTPIIGHLAIAASATNFATVYLVTPDSSARKVWASYNAGDDWINFTGDLDLDDWGQSYYNYALHCFRRELASPIDALLLANIRVFLGDAFGNWQSLGADYDPNAVMHVDNHAFATHPDNPNVHLIGNDGGAYRFDYDPDMHDGEITSLNAELGCVLVNRMSVHPTDPDFLMGGTQDNGTPIAVGNLLHWFNIVGGDTGHTAINQQFPQIQYACEPHLGRDDDGNVFIIRTDDYWNVGSGSELTTNIGDDRLRHGAPIVIDPSETNLLYFCSNYLYRYDEITQQWTNRVGGERLTNEDDGHVRTFDVAASNGDWIYTGSNYGEVFMTSDGGQTWTQIDDGELLETRIGAISVDPTNPRHVLVGFETTYWTTNLGEAIWECENTTANPRVWEVRVGSGLIYQGRLPRVPVNAIAYHPKEPKTHWFVGTDLGVFGTEDGGETWFDMTQPLGLPIVMVTDLRAQPQTNFLYAATYGRGFWRIELPPPPPNDLIGN